MNYQIGDFLIRIKNAVLSNKAGVEVVKTKQNLAVAQALKRAGFIQEIKQNKDILEVVLAKKNKKPVLLNLKLVSRPGLRIYTSVEEITSRKKPSLLLVSTPKGILTSKEAVKKNMGGEVITEII